eukprot:2346061-Pleurochrysis_carterae.AAC.3
MAPGGEIEISVQIASSGEAAMNNVAENLAIARQDGRQLKSAGPTRHRTFRAGTASAVVLLRLLAPTPIHVQSACSVALLQGFSAGSNFWLFLFEGYA